jgi:glutathione-specific gamma-glutamylcyclotransferase
MSESAGKIVFEGTGDVWFFAYGSLMWAPGFDHVEMQPALLRGYHRAFCVESRIYRGTPLRPGLVLGLDRGGACRGRAFRIARAARAPAARYLEGREMAEDIYFCRRLKVTLADRRRVAAYALVVNRRDVLYAGGLDLDATAARIARARGKRGTNRAYLESTLRHLDALGVKDGRLHGLLRRIEAEVHLPAGRALL